MALYSRQFHDIDSELDLVQEYVLTVAGALKSAHKTLREDICNKVAGRSADESQRIVNDYAEDDLLLGDYFPAINASWTFVSVISFIEHQAFQICRALQSADQGKLGVDDLRGAGMDACKVYLKKAHDIDLTSIRPAWDELDVRRKIRNVIVHRLGHLKEPESKDDLSIYSLIDGRNDLSVDAFRRIVLTQEFVQDTVEIARSFLKSATALIPKEYFERPATDRPR